LLHCHLLRSGKKKWKVTDVIYIICFGQEAESQGGTR
jgi:hypothetical protein